MPKNLKYTVFLVLIAVVAYNSFYFKKLDDVKANTGSNAGEKFDAAAYAQNFWTAKLLPASAHATELSTLIPLLKTDEAKAFATYSHALGIGNIRYFLVKGDGKITAVSDNDVTVSLPSGEVVKLATEYIFGNAARDASGLIKITEFDNTMDLNNVSAELNKIIRNSVLPTLKSSAKPGNTITFIGAIELNKAHLHLENLEVIPISVHEAAGMGVREKE
ncbi:DUF2291 domain-containing protein [Spirosoma validum]|uniref:DUF2291 domain-containing protein n=1 Tax=Spirosoma validum TaxID=2771355 RepID=A0A927GH12_9BACT|nr:DUF2291 domain-containing protein [Spirosoma validum]MBD2757451.1 DUF2291 domain-containing protein [Spirosoma validum]